MNNSKILWTGLVVVAIISVIGLLVGYSALSLHQSASTSTEGVTQATSFLPSIGAGQLSLGQNCTDAYKAAATGNTSNGCSDIVLQRASATSASTTPCAFLTPAATSTIVSFSFSPTTGTSTSATVTLATSTTAYATTSAFATIGSYVSTAAPITWSPGLNNAYLAPSTYVVMGEAATTATGGFVQSGECQLTTQTIN